LPISITAFISANYSADIKCVTPPEAQMRKFCVSERNEWSRLW